MQIDFLLKTKIVSEKLKPKSQLIKATVLRLESSSFPLMIKIESIYCE
jgi:hypothetical protein